MTAFLAIVTGCLVTTEPTPRAPAPTEPDLTVIFWFDRRRPLETFRYQVYDRRRGQYSPLVVRWLDDVRRGYPGYEAYARDVRLATARGDTEPHKIGAAVIDEFLVLGARLGYDFAPPILRAPVPSGVTVPARPPTRRTPAVPNLSPASAPFPVSLPYPRPQVYRTTSAVIP